MKSLEYTLRFTTPAFLGNAEQDAQWRTPPFKALIRQWWRVAAARRLQYAVDHIRQEEGKFFGVAGDGKDGSLKSPVRIRLGHWGNGSLDNARWPRSEFDRLRADRRDVDRRDVPADVYIGYGPVAAASRRLNMNRPQLVRRAIDPESATNTLRIHFTPDVSDDRAKEIEQAIFLANWFGTLGSRARNGWGSILFENATMARFPTSADELSPYVRPLEACLELDWPNAIGEDVHEGVRRPLMWTGKPVKNWREAVLVLAQTRRDIRRGAKEWAKQNGSGKEISANHLVAHPVPHYKGWTERDRLPNSLRLKVVPAGEGLVPVAVHLPCSPAADLLARLSPNDRRWIKDNQVKIWRAVHRMLDSRMKRWGG